MYVLYDNDNFEDTLGIMTFFVDYTSPPGVTITRLDKDLLDDFLGIPTDQASVGRLAYDSATGTLYAPFGCHGVVKYDTSNPADPVPVAHHPSPLTNTGDGPKEAVALHVALAPTASRIYVSYLWPGMLGVLDGNLSNEVLYLSPFQVPAAVPVPDSLLQSGEVSGTVLLTADGRGGVHRIVIP